NASIPRSETSHHSSTSRTTTIQHRATTNPPRPNKTLHRFQAGSSCLPAQPYLPSPACLPADPAPSSRVDPCAPLGGLQGPREVRVGQFGKGRGGCRRGRHLASAAPTGGPTRLARRTSAALRARALNMKELLRKNAFRSRVSGMRLTDARSMRALAHPLRIELFERLAIEGEATASELAPLVGSTPSDCSCHLRTLAEAGFIERVRGHTGRHRPWRVIEVTQNWSSAADGDEDLAQ